MRTTRGTNPEREAVKEYLQQYHDAKAKKQILEERHRTLSADLRDPGVGSAYRTMPTSKRQAREGGAVSLVYRIAEVEDRIGQQREAMAKAVLHVMDMIDILPQNSMERTVVEMRHIDCKPWEYLTTTTPPWTPCWPVSARGNWWGNTWPAKRKTSADKRSDVIGLFTVLY